MWSSTNGEGNNSLSTDNSNRVSCSSSKSSSTSSSSSPFPTSALPTPRRKTMEEVWKDIGLASLNEHPSAREELLFPSNKDTTTTIFPGMILQDLLGRPFTKEPPTTSSVVSITPTTDAAAADVDLFGCSPSQPPQPIALNLNSVPDFHYIDHTHSLSTDPQQVSSLNSTPFDAFTSSSGLSSLCKKRVSDSDENSGDRRHMRMIKNRESAARSRARKQESLSFCFVDVYNQIFYQAKIVLLE
uniref:FD-like protein 2-II n=1 Tax=Platanus acerifolia TaxID=140101 RepID=A0A4D6K758_PLAAC|nr:FD-like protein 2-II [Platanus x hispanica]